MDFSVVFLVIFFFWKSLLVLDRIEKNYTRARLVCNNSHDDRGKCMYFVIIYYIFTNGASARGRGRAGRGFANR